jgi:hypothetical protein
VVHGKGAGVRSTSIEGGAIPNFCLFKLTNMGYFSRNHPPGSAGMLKFVEDFER